MWVGPQGHSPSGLMELGTHSCGGVSSAFTNAGEAVESLLFHLFQPALEDPMPRVITGVSALTSTRPRESVSATLASTGRRASCAGQGDSGLTVSVSGTYAPSQPLVQLCAPCPDPHQSPALEACVFPSPSHTPPHLPPLTCFSPSDVCAFPSTERAASLKGNSHPLQPPRQAVAEQHSFIHSTNLYYSVLTNIDS